MNGLFNALACRKQTHPSNHGIPSILQQAVYVLVLLVASEMSAFAQRGNQAIMFGKSIASNGRCFVVSQVHPDPNTLFVFASGRKSTKFVSRLPAPTQELSNRFGDTIALSSSNLVVGNPRVNSGKGEVLVYPVSRSGQVNAKAVKRVLPDLAYRFGQFGDAISLSDNLIAVSAPHASSPGQASGIVYLFEKQRNSFKLVQKLTAGGPGGEIARFGDSLAMDEQCLVVGVPSAAKNRRGEVRIFPRNGKLYAQQPTLVLSDSAVPESSFGWQVTLSPDWLVVSALEKTAICDGAVYAYRRLKDGSIDRESKIQVKVPAVAAKPKDTFGAAVAVIDSLLFVSLTTPSTSGKVLIFDLEKASDGVADQVLQTLVPPTRSEPDQFGESLAVLGTNILIGSPPPIASKPLLGATYIFAPNKKGVYSVTATIDPQNGVKTVR